MKRILLQTVKDLCWDIHFDVETNVHRLAMNASKIEFVQHLFSVLIEVKIRLGVLDYRMLFVSMEHVRRMLDVMEDISVNMERMNIGVPQIE